MKTCGYCGRENGDDASHCQECGTQDFHQPGRVTTPPKIPARLVAVPRDPKSRGAFETAVPQISLVAWTLWLLLGLVLVAVERPKFSSLMDLVPLVSGFGGKAGGILLSALLIQRSSRRLALLLAILTAWAVWKFFFGEIILYTHPSIGGLTFDESVQAWWQRSTRTTLRAISTIPFCIFVVASAVTWPFYALFYGGTVLQPTGQGKQPGV